MQIKLQKGWEGCGAGVNGTQHDANGIPTIDSAFPDTAKMVEDIHALDLSAGTLVGLECPDYEQGARNEMDV